MGIYRLLSFTVALPQQEFGIRLAPGAHHADIFRVVLGQGAGLAITGQVPGLAVAHLAARLPGSLLAGVRPADALTFSSASALCLITTLLGTLVPALRATRVDPAAGHGYRLTLGRMPADSAYPDLLIFLNRLSLRVASIRRSIRSQLFGPLLSGRG